jgi:hypothetical protein
VNSKGPFELHRELYSQACKHSATASSKYAAPLNIARNVYRFVKRISSLLCAGDFKSQGEGRDTGPLPHSVSVGSIHFAPQWGQ